jgi:hypothetical protein
VGLHRSAACKPRQQQQQQQQQQHQQQEEGWQHGQGACNADNQLYQL